MLGKKICLACSGGGHLTELMQLQDFYSRTNHFFVTFKRPNSSGLAENEKTYFLNDPKRNPLGLIINFFSSLKIFLKEKPFAVVSTGAGVAVPMCFIGKLFGAKIIFIESYCRINTPSLSGRMVYPVADLFIVQWPEMKKFFPKAAYFGGFF